ncbi:keratin-associated protein 14-like [Vicugna pacos]|uniref:Keratin-associated protein n=1 Tax=Vicugna pacos TaxID=30538 RepID=A0A6I9IGB9_VICPA|nr:keratin-associated protein 13-1-like [Vicugna pacos]
MSYNCCSGNFSSRSFGGHLRCRGSSCGSSYPSNLVYTTDLCSPSTCQQDSSLHSGCQEICSEPIRCQTFQVESSPCQSSCYRWKTSTLCRPWQTTYSGSLGFGSRGFQSFGCGFPSLGFGSSGFQSVGCGPRAFSSVRWRSSFDSPNYFSSRSWQPASFQPIFRSGFF